MRQRNWVVKGTGVLRGSLTRIWRRPVSMRQTSREQISQSALRISPSVRAGTDGGSLIVLDIRSGRLFRSNQTGSLIWLGLAANQPLEAIAIELSTEYGLTPVEVLQSVAEYVRQLLDLGLLLAE
jgi:hypothetical protein